jgi:hypothetical protein
MPAAAPWHIIDIQLDSCSRLEPSPSVMVCETETTESRRNEIQTIFSSDCWNTVSFTSLRIRLILQLMSVYVKYSYL